MTFSGVLIGGQLGCMLSQVRSAYDRIHLRLFRKNTHAVLKLGQLSFMEESLLIHLSELDEIWKNMIHE